MHRIRLLVATAVSALLLLPLSAGPVASATIGSSAVRLPPANGVFDYQIGGGYTPAKKVTIVDRDRTGKPAPGRYNICYVNAFQAQTGQTRWWKRHHPRLLLKDHHGRYVVDRGWNEILLDIRTKVKRHRLAAIEGRWMAGCAAKGFQGVEPDNLDSWTRSHHLLTRHEAIAFATLLVRHAHATGLAIAQKNAAEISAAGRHRIGFDFAIAEECQRYTGPFGKECATYLHYYGNQVYEIEYKDNGGLKSFRKACAARGKRISITYRDRDVVPRGTKGYLYRTC